LKAPGESVERIGPRHGAAGEFVARSVVVTTIEREGVRLASPMHVARLGKESDESVSDRLQLVLATKDLKTLAGKN
jgi:hypothetical protein